MKFPAKSLMDDYMSVENALASFLYYVPFCTEHERVWSPKLASILLESCSQLDSLWKYQARLSRFVPKKLDIEAYQSLFGSDVSSRWIVFYGEEISQIRPFQEWNGTTSYQPIDWWSAYNSLKHDRYMNRSEATVIRAVNAVGGLYLAILKAEFCRQAVEEAGWLLGDGHNLKAWLGEDSLSTKDKYITVESKLFTYPLGWSNEKLGNNKYWEGTSSLRFKEWFNSQN